MNSRRIAHHQKNLKNFLDALDIFNRGASEGEYDSEVNEIIKKIETSFPENITYEELKKIFLAYEPNHPFLDQDEDLYRILHFLHLEFKN